MKTQEEKRKLLELLLPYVADDDEIDKHMTLPDFAQIIADRVAEDYA